LCYSDRLDTATVIGFCLIVKVFQESLQVRLGLHRFSKQPLGLLLHMPDVLQSTVSQYWKISLRNVRNADKTFDNHCFCVIDSGSEPLRPGWEIAAPTTDRNRTHPNTSRRIRYDSAWASNRHGRVGQYAAAVRSDTAAPSDAHRKNSDRPPSSQSAAPSVWSMGHYRMKHRPDSLPDWDVLISTRTWPFLPSFRSVLPSAASVWHLAPRILANRWAKIEPEAVSLCVAKGPARRL